MALREVLAELDVKVRGLGAIRTANVELDQYVGAAGAGASAVDNLRIKQAEAAEMAGRLAARIRDLQKAEGDHSAEINELRLAHLRATDAAAEYADAAYKIANAEGIAAAAAKKAASEQAQAAKQQAQALSAVAKEEDKAAAAAEKLAKEQKEALKKEHADVASAIGVAVAGIAAAAAVAYRAAEILADQIHAVIDAGSELDDLSNQLGVNAQRLQEWGYIADQSGTSLDTITRGLEGVTRSVHAGSAAYGRLGVSTRGSNGELRRTEDILNDSLTALAGVSNETERATLAQQLFGGANRELLGVVRQGPEELARLRREFHELGGGMSAESIAAAAETGDALNEIRLASLSLRDVLTPLVLPAVTGVLREFTGGIATLTRIGRETTLVGNAWRLGGTVLRGFAPQLRLAGSALRFFLAPWVGAVLVIDDVTTALNGGHSAIGRWAEELLAANGHVLTFQGYIQSLRVDLLDANAQLLTLAAEFNDWAGDSSSDYGRGLRSRSDSAIADFRGARDSLARDEEERFRSRGLIARGDIIGGGGIKGDIALREARRDAGIALTRNSTTIINGGDLNEVRRVIREERDRDSRDAVDALGLAPAEGT